jgi:hypothetical protein
MEKIMICDKCAHYNISCGGMNIECHECVGFTKLSNITYSDGTKKNRSRYILRDEYGNGLLVFEALNGYTLEAIPIVEPTKDNFNIKFCSSCGSMTIPSFYGDKYVFHECSVCEKKEYLF